MYLLDILLYSQIYAELVESNFDRNEFEINQEKEGLMDWICWCAEAATE